jgi:hypothetical protein
MSASKGAKIVRDFITNKNDEVANKYALLVEAVNTAIAEGERAGFEAAVAGGADAGRRVPGLAASRPLILYFADDFDREDFVRQIADLAGLEPVKVPEVPR